MSEEEFINRIINQISKDYGSVMANELKYIIIRKEREINKQKEVLDKIKEWVYHQQQSNENLEPYISTDKLDYILELLEEIE